LNENTTPATALSSPPLDKWGALHAALRPGTPDVVPVKA
jgi:hypothetical protein